MSEEKNDLTRRDFLKIGGAFVAEKFIPKSVKRHDKPLAHWLNSPKFRFLSKTAKISTLGL